MMPETEQPIRWLVHFTGRVQGVGFRYTTAQIAQDRPVHGYVRNLPDGRVELAGEGTKTNLTAFLAEVQRAMGRHIHNTQISEQAATGEFTDFRVHH